MRTFVSLAVLIVVGCSGGPTPEDVAGVYDLYSRNGEVFDREGYPDGEVFWELNPDGNFTQHLVMPHDGSDYSMGDTIRSLGGFSVIGEDAGCISVVLWRETDPESKKTSTICGDDLISREEIDGKEMEEVYKKRQ